MNAAGNSSTVLPVEIGEVIANKFRVERLIGRGGTGVVMLATHLQLDERVALKFLDDDGVSDRAVKEARACLRLKTKHVARVIDVGRHGKGAFIVMEYLEGKDLQALLEENGRLEDPAEAVELVVQVCEAVAEAHRAGIIHRDIKLANLFLVASRSSVPHVKLLDFGIANADVGAAVAPEEQTVGTLHYMSPEAVQGISDDPRADLWSLGVVLFELLTGWKPFDSKEAVALIAEIYEQQHHSLRSIRDDIPLELEAVIDRALEKDPAHRFQNAGELADALRPFAPPRAHVTIDRAIELCTIDDDPSGQPTSERPSAPSSRQLRISDPAIRKSTTLRASGERRLGASGSMRSVPSLTSTSPNAAPNGRGVLPWAIAICAVAALALVFTFRHHLGAGETPAATAATTPPLPASAAVDPTPPPPSPPVAVVAPSPSPSPPPSQAARPMGRANAPVPARAPAAPARGPETTTTPAPTTPPAAAPASARGLEHDPWRSSKPKLEDSPFR